MNPILDRLNEIEGAKRDEFRYQVVKVHRVLRVSNTYSSI